MKIPLRSASATQESRNLPASSRTRPGKRLWSLPTSHGRSGEVSATTGKRVVRVSGEVVFGFVATAVTLAGFLGWTWHELRRVDTVVERRERRD